MKSKLKLHLLFLAILSASALARAQSTAFTYNGRLNNNGAPVSGAHALRFTLYDASAAGNVVAGPVTVSPVDVVNGLFTLKLDFGAGVFTGPARWLNIEVQPPGGGGFTPLSPRHEVTSSPYAIRAQTAGTAADVNLGTVVKSLNGLRDDLTLAAGANVTITPNGNTLTIGSAGAGGSGIWSVLNNNAYYNAGKVGIGTNTPANKLTVRTPTLDYGIEHTDGDIRLGTFVGRGTGYLGTLSNHKLTFFANDNGFPNMTMTLATTGGVGMGTDSPQARLHLYDPAGAVSHLIETGGGINAWAKVAFKNLNGQWDIGTSRGFQGDAFYVDRLGTSPLEFLLAPNGNLGLGIYPLAKLDIYDPVGPVSQRIGTGGGVNAWTRVEFANGNGQWNVGTSRGFNGDQFYFHRQGATVNAFAIQPNGDAFLEGTMSCKVLTIRGGADVAEPFAMPEEIAKGSVVVIDDAHPGKLKLSGKAYDTRVAGIVSGANGINPGIALHQEGALEGGQNVALSGRVYVQADAAFGAIKPGDLLTTSDTPGHAMKVTEHGKSQGAILGKAMSGLKDGKGMVLVLVTLQ